VLPVTSPVVLFTVTLPDGLLHVPPAGVALSVVMLFTHTVRVPVTGVGTEFTVPVTVMKQPLPMVYVNVVVPEVMPQKEPALVIEPTAGLLLVQIPPPGVPITGVQLPSHTVGAAGLMPVGSGFTAITVVRIQPVVGAV
jgi:hypothetical protein